MPELPVVIVLGLSPTGLYAVREIGRAGFSVLGVADDLACGEYSRLLTYPDKAWRCRTSDILYKRLLAWSDNAARPAVLLPTSDRYIEFIGQHYEILSDRFIFPASYGSTAQTLMDKGSFHRLCTAHGIDTPGVWQAGNKPTLRQLAARVPFPCILKPMLIHRATRFLRGKKVLLAKDRIEFEALTERIPEGLDGWLVQEVIPGPESNITLFGGYFDRAGKPLQTFTARELRQYPIGFGSASLVRSEHCQETLTQSIEFLTAIGFQGVCGTEFKRDPRDGKLKIIEINPRPTLWFGVTHAAGRRIVETACRDLVGLPVNAHTPQVDGIVWRYALKDIYSRLYYRFKGKHFILPPPEIDGSDVRVNGRTWPVFDLSDPLPALIEPIQFLKKLTGRMA
jgi:predicted ATP-grasp superfamily ATP-dependent carboligase